MSRASRALRAVAVVAALAVALPAAAYRRSVADGSGHGLFWSVPLVPYHVSSAPAEHGPSCAGAGGGEPALAAVEAGFAAWRQGCADLELLYAGRIDEVRTGLAGTHENLVVFRRGWCTNNADAAACLAAGGEDCDNAYDCFDDSPPMDRGIVALTNVLYEPDSGRIVDADIEVNGWDGSPGSLTGSGYPPHGWYFTCDTRAEAGRAECTSYGQASCNYVDLRNTVTHEVGHFLGLAHPCGDQGAPRCSADPGFALTTMYPQTTLGDVEKQSLAADDAAGVCAIYPTGGGCGCGSAGAPGAAALLLAALALRPRRRR